MGNILSWFKGIFKPCTVCHGAGVLPAGLSDEEMVSCSVCHGRGVLDKKETLKHVVEMPCDNPGCHNGKVEKQVRSEGAIRTQQEDCPVCNGLNRVVRTVEESYDAHRTCPVCTGAGMVSGKRLRERHLETLCYNCRGIGRTVDKKKILMLLPAVGLVALNPVVAFGVLLFGGIGFSLYAVRANKTPEPQSVEELYKRES